MAHRSPPGSEQPSPDPEAVSAATEPAPQPRWFAERTPRQRRTYADHFVRLAADGQDVDGEARFVDAMAGRRSTILDAGCGVGRVAAALDRLGHRAAGVDADPTLVDRGRELSPGLPLARLDLWNLTSRALAEQGLPTSYDLIVCAGNVMLFVAEDTEHQILGRLARLLRPGGRAVFGFFTGREYTHDDLDVDAATVGWSHEHRFATWHLDAFQPDSDWAVSVYRGP